MPAAPTPLTVEEELLYRRDFLRADGRMMLFGCGLAFIFSAAFAMLDYRWLGDSREFYLLLTARTLFLAFSLLTAWVAAYSESIASHEWTALVWGLLAVLLNVGVVLSRPPTFTHNVVPELAIVVLMYLILPDRIPWRFLPPLAFSASSLWLLTHVKELPTETAYLSVVSAFVAANVIGIVASIQIFRYRRRSWKSERELRSLAQERQQMLDMKNRLIATLSHEFRSPLNVISSSAILLGRYHDDIDDAQREAITRRMQAAVGRLVEMTDEALFVSRRDAGHRSVNPMAVDIHPWLAALADELQTAHAGDREVVVDIGLAIGTHLIDPVLTKRIVVNLFTNACKFAPARGRIRLSARCGPAALELEIADNGCGIPADDLPHVFEPFHRAANAAAVEGTGLGLAIVREAVELLGGRVELSSTPGQGTTAFVSLPFADACHG